MERSIDEKERDIIINFGALEYGAPFMASVLGWEVEEVKRLMKDKDSEFYGLYMKGKNTSEYLIELKLFEMAKGGDLKALKELQVRKQRRKDKG